MGYFEIIIIGYLANILIHIIILLTLLTIIDLKNINHVKYLTLLNKTVINLEKLRNLCIKHKINPFVQYDFIWLLPFGSVFYYMNTINNPLLGIIKTNNIKCKILVQKLKDAAVDDTPEII